MTRLIHSLALLVIIMLVLVSCNIGSTSTGESLTIQNSPASQAAILELSVQVDTSIPYTTVGQIINFNLYVKNVGNAGVSGQATVTGAAATCPPINTIGNLNDSLDPNETLVCPSPYTIQQADLDHGSVAITVMVTINGLNSNPATSTVTLIQPKVLTLTTSANPTTYSQVGQQITLSYVVKNSGSQTLGPAQFTVTDTLISPNPFNCGDATVTLVPNNTFTCTATYTVTQADMNAASITNVATVTGGGAGASNPASATIAKGNVPNGSGNLTPGITIQYTVETGDWLWQIARCYGANPKNTVAANTQLSNPSQIKKGMVVTVPNIGSAGTIFGPPCVVKYTVKSGDSWSSIAAQFNADPTITSMANRNTLTVGSDIYVPRNSKGGYIPPTGSGPLTLTTTANPTTYSQVGQQITFLYDVKNTGSTTLGPAQFTVTDTLISATPFNCGNSNTTLAPNATLTCTASYSVTQADLNAASITSVATASGGGAGTSQSTTVTINKGGTTTLTLTPMASPLTYDQVGQQITYTYIIKNTGSTTLGPAQFTVTDTLISATPFNCGNVNTTLTPNTSVTCFATYTITQADIDAASVTNVATASGGGAGPSPTASFTIHKGAKTLTLTTSASPLSYDLVGQQITFSYEIKNTGNVNLGPAQFTVSDSLISPTAFNCGPANITLAPTQTVTCTATYTITQADMNVVSVSNLATASGGGAGPSQFATVTINRQ